MKILHVLYVSVPTVDGSSTRSLDIVSSQKDIGLNPVVITSPFQRPRNENSTCEEIFDIKYFRTYANSKELHSSEKHSSIFKRVYKIFFIIKFIKLIVKTVKEEEVDVIHAHSTFFCGISAKLAGYISKRPVIYELRSLWEERQKDSKNFIQRTSANIITFLETISMRIADRVIVINKNLLDNVISRGIKKENSFIIPNAVNLRRIEANVSKNIVTLKTSKKLTFGYIGNISEIEGLLDLCKVFNSLKEQEINNELLIYGSGPELENLEKYLTKNNLTNVVLKGIVENSNIYKAFESIDIIVNPRVKSKITDTVTPLKPLEAMGYKKLVIASDVGGMKELLVHNETGLLFKADSKSSLEAVIKEVLENKEQFYPIIEKAYTYVKLNKSWHSNAKKYQDIYEGL